MELHVRYVLVGIFVLVLTLAGLSFALWIQNRGSVQEKFHLIVRFEGTASGLRVGAPVTFNGVRIGEVSRLEFDRSDLDAVIAHLDVEAQVPITGTTNAVLEPQGWLGNAFIALSGGDRQSPLDRSKGYPVLVAQSSKPLARDARETLQALRSLAADNADGIRDSVANIRNFSDVLSRNGERVENIIKGLEKTLGGSGQDVKPSVYDLRLPEIETGLSKDLSVAVADPTVAASFESQRLMQVDGKGEITPTAIQFTDTISKLIQRRLIQGLESVGLEHVGTAQDVATADVQIAIDLRRFQLVTDQKVQISMGLRLVSGDNKVMGHRLFETENAIASEEPKEIVSSVNEAFAHVLKEALRWIAERMVNVETKTGAVDAPVQ